MYNPLRGKIIINISHKEHIKTRESKLLILVLFLLSIYSFVGYMLPGYSQYGLLVLSMVVLIFSLIIQDNLKFSTNQLILVSIILLFVAEQLLLAPHSMFPENSMKVAINRSVILIIGAFLSLRGNWFKIGIKILYLFSCAHAAFTVISYLLPSFFNNKILPFLPQEISSEITYFLVRNLYPGITDQIGRNGFYITVGISILYCQVIISNWKSNRYKYAQLLFLFLALLLTGKRGHLLANLMVIVFISAIYSKYRNKNFILKIIKTVFILVFITFLLVIIFPEAAAPFMRFIARQGGDQSSGRFVLFSYALDMFKQKPILGWGPGTFSNLFGIGNHNVYLQLLSENGLVGFTLFVSMLLVNLANTLRRLKLSIQNNSSSQVTIHLLFSLYVQVYYLIYGMIGNPLNDGFILIIYLIAASIPYTVRINENRTIMFVTSFRTTYSHALTKGILEKD